MTDNCALPNSGIRNLPPTCGANPYHCLLEQYDYNRRLFKADPRNEVALQRLRSVGLEIASLRTTPEGKAELHWASRYFEAPLEEE